MLSTQSLNSGTHIRRIPVGTGFSLYGRAQLDNALAQRAKPSPK